MSLDDTPNNTPDYTQVPDHNVPKMALKQSRSAPSWGGIILATILSGIFTAFMLYILGFLNLGIPISAPHPTPATDQPWQAVQTDLQTLRQTQQQLSQQTANNQQQIQHLMQEQSSPSQDWTLQTVRYYLELAQINAQWSHNPPTTISLLQAADQMLADHNQPNGAAIRQAIADDLSALQAIPTIHTDDILNKINTLSQQIDQLKTHLNPVTATSAIHSSAEPTTWRENLNDSMQQLRGLISIHQHDEGWLPPMPEYVALLRENIRMMLQQAQLGAIEQHQALFTTAVQSAANTVGASFDPKDANTQTVLQALRSLQTTTVAYVMPALHPYAQFFDQTLPDSSAGPISATKVSS